LKSKKVLSSILGSTFFKIVSGLVSFISVPLLIKTLGIDDYAVWVTITALVAWLNLFDFGSGYSLKNKITEAYATDNLADLSSIVAGTIQFYALMTCLIAIVFAGSFLFVDVFKKQIVLTLIIYLPIILSFPFTLGHFITQGLKKFNFFNLILLSQSVIWLLVIYLFKLNFFEVSIYKLAICYSMLFAVANLILLLKGLRGIKFDWSTINDFAHLRNSTESLRVGGKFFLLQVSSLFLYSLGNIMTYSNLKLINVAQYDTVNKIFLLGMTLFNVVISVFWAEISHAKVLADKNKLFKIYKQLLFCALAFSIGAIIVAFFAPMLIGLWTNNHIVIANRAAVYPFALLVIVQAFAYCGAVFLNAFEQLRGQIILSVIASLLIIPLSKLFFSFSIGISSVPLASAILTFPTLLYVLYKAKSCIIGIAD
jgi:O-antigen/teichoic acid export membrane protein